MSDPFLNPEEIMGQLIILGSAKAAEVENSAMQRYFI
jgi:hypothetical protein